MRDYNIQPLADKFRPKSLVDFIGQEEAVGKNSFLNIAISKDSLSSLIFWGPAGVGKTTLALIIARESKAEFVKLSATSSGLKDLRLIILRAESNKRLGKKTILFIDEIHRWNKSQQDALLPHVENGTVILIGATTENPSFEINSALLSRAQVIVLECLNKKDLNKIITRVEKELNLKISKKAKDIICQLANGDARQALNILEKAIVYGKEIDEDTLAMTIKKLPLYYDKADEHYNLISALHKSMRGNDANAAVYYLARMLEGGEDPLYIARRLIRFASEDVGLANNSALMLANSSFEACYKIGMPECGVILSHLVIYLAKSKKSILAYSAYSKAKEEVLKSGNLRPPLHILNAPTDFMKKLGYAKDYKYTPLEDSSEQSYLPELIAQKKFFDQ